MATTPWTSLHAVWLSQSKPFPGSFTPSRDTLLFTQLLHAPAEHNGFEVAFFAPNIAVDKMGRVYCVPAEQFHGIVLLARHTLELPETGSFMNTWRLKHEKSDRDIRRLLVATNERQLKETSVYGYEKEREELQQEVQGRTKLPEVLRELFGLLEETREGYKKGGEDSSLIEAIKALL